MNILAKLSPTSDWTVIGWSDGWMAMYRLEMGGKFMSSLSDSGELLLMIQDFAPADVGEYKVVVENELGSASQIVKMEMSGTGALLATTIRLRFDGRSTAYQRSLRSQ